MLEFVPPERLSVDDFASFYEADANGPKFNTISPPEAVRRIWAGELLAYRAPGGTFLLEVVEGGDGTTRLGIVRMAGKGLALHFEQISRDLQHIARDHGCVAIETVVYDGRLAKALTRGGAKQEAITMVLELDDGQEQEQN